MNSFIEDRNMLNEIWFAQQEHDQYMDLYFKQLNNPPNAQVKRKVNYPFDYVNQKSKKLKKN